MVYLHGIFTKHLKRYTSSGPAMKVKHPYYFAEFTNFLMPFTKSRTFKGNIHQRREQSQASIEDKYLEEEMNCPYMDINTDNEGQESNEELEDMSQECHQNECTKYINGFDEEPEYVNEDESVSRVKKIGKTNTSQTS